MTSCLNPISIAIVEKLITKNRKR